MTKLVILSVFPIIGIMLMIPSAFAQSDYVIKIPTGSADPNAPYFWQSEKDGDTSGVIQVVVNDFVTWANADTAAHTVTSGSAENGPDGIFDSSLFPPGDSFTYQFTEIGQFPYFCLVHPWMAGEVIVKSGFKVIPDVGADAGDGLTTFDVEYQIDKIISKAEVNQEQKSITFTLTGKGNIDKLLQIKLPKNLIKGPYAVWVDGIQVESFNQVEEGGINSLAIPVKPESETVTVVGTSVVPEFGSIAVMIMAVAIISVILFTSKHQIRMI